MMVTGRSSVIVSVFVSVSVCVCGVCVCVCPSDRLVLGHLLSDWEQSTELFC